MTKREKRIIPNLMIQLQLCDNFRDALIFTSYITRTHKGIIESIYEKNIDIFEQIGVDMNFNVIDFLIKNNINTQTSNLYIIRQKDTNFFKVGITTDIEKRFSAIQNGNPADLEIKYNENFFLCETIEKNIHKHLELFHVRGEWFQMTPNKLKQLIEKLENLIFKNEQN